MNQLDIDLPNAGVVSLCMIVNEEAEQMKSQGSGESYVDRPLSRDKFFEVCDPVFEADWYCNMYGVRAPVAVKQTHGARSFHGSYYTSKETITYTKPYLGVILHETAHHICHKLGLNGRGAYHDGNFGRVLQEMIDWTL